MSIEGKRERRVTGRMVLWGFIGFFSVVAAVNGVFIALSLDSFPGLQTDDAYRKGLSYDRVLDADAAQRARGWTVAVSWQGGVRGRISVSARDRDGSPLADLIVTATFRRPARAGEDRTVSLASVGGGSYGTDLTLPGPGNWEVGLRLARAGLPDYLLRERITVP
jgi:nitrogen fixation protein FixH